MSRIYKQGRDWLDPRQPSRWQDSTYAFRFQQPRSEPLWKSITAWVLILIPIAILIYL